MKNSVYIFLFMLVSGSASAQGGQVSLSLNQAMEAGLKNRFDVQAYKYNPEIATNEAKKSKMEWIPDISATGNVRYNPELQAIYVPKGFGGLTEPQLIALGARNNSVFALELNQVIWKPGIATDVKIAANNAELEKEKNRDNDDN